MSGEQTLRGLHELVPGLPVSVMSGSPESPLMETSEHFLPKTFRMAELTDAVATLLQRRT